MQFSSSFISEFLSETNLILTQENYGNRLGDLLTPIKSYFQKEDELLSFSLARFCGASSKLSFASEWDFQTAKLTFNADFLTVENLNYWKSKVPEKYKSLNNLNVNILKDVQDLFLPQQIAFLHNKNKEFRDDLLLKYPYLSKYLNNNYLSLITANELASHKKLYTLDYSINDFMQAQSMRLSFMRIGLPCLLGFTYAFNQPDHVVNPNGIKWTNLEEILKQISALHQIALDPQVANFVYITKLGVLPELEWLDKPQNEQLNLASKSIEVKDFLDAVRQKIHQETVTQLENFVFPDKYKEMLLELLDWAYNIRGKSHLHIP